MVVVVAGREILVAYVEGTAAAVVGFGVDGLGMAGRCARRPWLRYW